MADDGGDGGSAGLEGAISDAAMQPHQLLPLLRHPGVTPALIQRISRSPVWMRSYKVRSALVLHPKTPRAVAMGLLSSLRWSDLARVAAASRLSIALRTAADRILLLRIPELALGEKVSLARVATPAVIRGLRGDSSSLVARALLENPALRFEEALFMAERPDASGAVLSVLAESPRFARRPELRLALAAHPRTPAAVALRLVAGLETSGLATLATSDGAPILVRVAAERRLEPGPKLPLSVKSNPLR